MYKTITQTHDRTYFQTNKCKRGFRQNNDNGITMVKSAMSKEIYLSTQKHFDVVYCLEEITLKLVAIKMDAKVKE